MTRRSGRCSVSGFGKLEESGMVKALEERVSDLKCLFTLMVWLV